MSLLAIGKRAEHRTATFRTLRFSLGTEAEEKRVRRTTVLEHKPKYDGVRKRNKRRKEKKDVEEKGREDNEGRNTNAEHGQIQCHVM